MGRRLGWLIGLVVALAVLATAVLFVDNLARDYAEKRVGKEIASKLIIESDSKVDVRLGGFPFLLTALTKKLANGQVDLANVTVSGSQKPIHLLGAHAEVTGLKPVDDPNHAMIDTLDAAVTIDWASISTQVGNGIILSSTPEGQLQAQVSVNIFGAGVGVLITGQVQLVDATGQLQLVNPKAELGGVDVPETIVEGMLASVQDQLRLPDISPLQYTSVNIAADGATATITGTDVDVAELLD